METKKKDEKLVCLENEKYISSRLPADAPGSNNVVWVRPELSVNTSSIIDFRLQSLKTWSLMILFAALL